MRFYEREGPIMSIAERFTNIRNFHDFEALLYLQTYNYNRNGSHRPQSPPFHTPDL